MSSSNYPAVLPTFTGLTFAIAALATAMSTSADVINSHWAGGSGNWSIASNWNPAQVPNNGGGDVFHVTIDGQWADPLITLNMGATIQSLTVADSALLWFNNGQSLTVRSGPIFNSSGILMNSTGSHTNLILGSVLGDDIIELFGGGQLVMSASTHNRIYGAADTNRLVNHDNLIRGAGHLGMNQMRITNHGTIRANQPNVRLHMDPRDGVNGVINTGTIEARDSGILRLDPGQFVNTNGIIRSGDSSTVELFWAEVLGGELIAESNAVLKTVSSVGQDPFSHISAHLVVDPSATFDVAERTFLIIYPQGTYENFGQIRLLAGGYDAHLRIAGDVSISGGGLITLNHSERTRIFGTQDTYRLTNVDNIIRGRGQLGLNQMRLTNLGTIRGDDPNGILNVNPRAGVEGVINDGIMEAVDSGALRLEFGQFINTNGLIRSGADSTVELRGAEVVGGDVVAEAGSVIQTAGGGNDVSQITSHLIIDPTAQLRVTDNTFLDLHPQGTFENSGQIRIVAGSWDTRLRIAGDVSISGGGEITLNHNTRARIYGTEDTHRLTNVDNLIRGRGHIGLDQMRLTNLGIIRADDANGTLNVDPRNGVEGVINSGIMEAVDSGILRLNPGQFVNTDGVIRSRANSTVELFWAEVLGGDVIAEADSVIQTTGGGNNVSHISGNLVIEPLARLDITNSTRLTLHPQGVYENAGQLRVFSAGSDTRLRIEGDVSIGGGGEIQLSHGNARVDSATTPDVYRLTNLDNVIRGTGNLGFNSIGIVNHGTIDADSVGVLTIDPSVALGLENHGTLQASSVGGMTINSGPFTTSGEVAIDPTSKLTRHGNFHQTAGTTHVRGTLQINSGTLQLEGGLLTGDGVIIGPVSNGTGVVLPGSDSSAELTIQGAYLQSADGEFQVVANKEAGISHLQIAGEATIAGAMHVTVDPDFRAPLNAAIPVLSAASVIGEFDQVTSSHPIKVAYTSTEVLVSFLGCEGADLNCDGVVDVSDLLILLANWGPCPRSGECPADLNGDGAVDVSDLLILLANWG